MGSRNGASPRLRRALPALRWRMLGKYGLTSLLATGLSQATFALVYYLGAAPTVASISAFVAGAIPNYLLNRFWTWQRRDRIGGFRELLPYLAIVVGTALLAVGVTNVTDALVAPVRSHLVRTALVTGSYLATYALMFGFKFLLLDRLIFGRAARISPPAPVPDAPAPEAPVPDATEPTSRA